MRKLERSVITDELDGAREDALRALRADAERNGYTWGEVDSLASFAWLMGALNGLEMGVGAALCDTGAAPGKHYEALYKTVSAMIATAAGVEPPELPDTSFLPQVRQ